MKHIKGIFFDFDGVLVDTIEEAVKAHQVIAKMTGTHCPTREEISSCYGLNFKEYLAKLCPDIDSEEFLRLYRNLRISKEDVPQIPGAAATITQLSQNFLLSLISNRESFSLFSLMQLAQIDQKYFQYIQAGEDGPFHKPDHRVFNSILSLANRLGIEENQTLYIGDTLIDYHATQNTNINFVAVLSGIGTKEEFLSAGLNEKFILPSIQHLPEFLDKN